MTPPGQDQDQDITTANVPSGIYEAAVFFSTGNQQDGYKKI